jgi:hypothetical protein
MRLRALNTVTGTLSPVVTHSVVVYCVRPEPVDAAAGGSDSPVAAVLAVGGCASDGRSNRYALRP